MGQKEKQIVVSLATTIVICTIYVNYIYKNYVLPQPELLNDVSFLGKAFLAFIPVAILSQIAILIVFAIINMAVTKEEPDDKSDERDKLIELKSIRVSHWVFISGFLLAVASQAIGMHTWVMFVVLFSSAITSGIIAEVVKLWFYRKGC